MMSRLLLWILFCACFVAIFWVLRTSALAFSTAALSVLCFITIDAKWNDHFRGWLGISFFGCALAYVVIIGFFTMLFTSTPATSSSSENCWPVLFHLLSGEFLREIMREIAVMLALLIQSTLTIIACTLISLTTALAATTNTRSYRILQAMNSPGIALTIYCVSALVLTSFGVG